MAIDATVETFEDLVAQGNVLLDVWGPECAPCLALMPAVEALEEKFSGRITLLKLNAPENRIRYFRPATAVNDVWVPLMVSWNDPAPVPSVSTSSPSRFS